MKTVFLLSSCDEWHSYSSIRLIGLFAEMSMLIDYLKKNDNLSHQEIEQLCTIRQTQGRHVNYIIEELKVNQPK